MNIQFDADIPRNGINFSGRCDNYIIMVNVEVRVDYEPDDPKLIMAIHCHDKYNGKMIYTAKHEDDQLEMLALEHIKKRIVA